jgi:polyvinyl alcohol dehydrogenase (cytochrome)
MVRRVFAGLFVSSLILAAPPDGAAIYNLRCAKCHDKPEERVPAKATIAKRPPEVVVKALTSGPMAPFAAGLTAPQIAALATYLTGKAPGTTAPSTEANICSGRAPRFSLDGPQWVGWGRDLDNSRFQPNPGLSPEDVPKLKVKWAFGFPDTITYGQPTIAGSRLFVTSTGGRIYSLDANTGCTYWSFDAGAGVRTAISIGPLPAGSAAKYAAYFGDEKAYVQAIDAESGLPLWKTRLDEHPLARIAGAPVLYRNRLFVPVSSWEEGAGRDPKYECCKFQGSIAALDAYTGKLIWQTHSLSDPPKAFKKNSAGTQMYGPAGAAIWSAPTVDLARKAVYAATGNSYTDADQRTANAILAFDMESGSLRWSNQATPKDNFLVGCMAPGVGNCPTTAGPDADFGSSPIIRTLSNGKQVILAGQKSGMLYALDPDERGKVLWQEKVGEGSALGGIEWGPAADNEQVYVAISDVMPKRGKTPGGLTALKIATGERVWQTPAPKAVCAWGASRCSSAQSAAVTVIPGVVFSGSLDGHLRAYSTRDGSIVWDFDTGQEFPSVNGIKTKGGSLDTAGPTIAGGMLFVNSGYGRFVGQPGNALIAFSVDGK